MNFLRFLFGTLLLAALVGAGYLGYQEYLAPVTPTPTPVLEAPGPALVTAEGRVVPNQHVTLAFPLAGPVAHVWVEEGDWVQEGDVLVELDVPELVAQVEQAQAALEVAQIQRDLLPKRASDEEQRMAEARVEQAQAALDAALATLEKASLVAPFDGTVTEVLVQESEVAPPLTPVVVLADTSQWKVETLDLREEDVVKLQEGQPATVKVAALPDLVLVGRISQIARSASSHRGNVTYTITVDLLTQEVEELSWGMTAFVEADPEQAQVLIPPVTPEPTPTPTETPTPTPDPEQADAPVTATPMPAVVHVVERGENLSQIAEKYGTTMSAIREENNLRGTILYPGQKLTIPVTPTPQAGD